jgi:hypothetical protein
LGEIASILWRRLDTPGHEAARIVAEGSAWRLNGCAVFAHEGKPCRLEYSILCDGQWKTRSADVNGWVGDTEVNKHVDVNSEAWRLNGEPCPAVSGCIDLDLNFSPSTNLLPIRRLNLPVGQQAIVRAAWLRFPSFVLEPLDQVYRRVGELSFRYESAGGKFVAMLETNAAGFVAEYPNLWIAEAAA